MVRRGLEGDRGVLKFEAGIPADEYVVGCVDMCCELGRDESDHRAGGAGARWKRPVSPAVRDLQC
jgi:hypothetical protein